MGNNLQTALDLVSALVLITAMIILWAHMDHAAAATARITGSSLRSKFHRQRWLWKAGSVGGLVLSFAVSPETLERPALLGARLAGMALFALPYWWVVFDAVMGHLLAGDPLHIGTTAGTDRLLGRLQARHRWSALGTIARVKGPLLLLCSALLAYVSFWL